MPNPGRSPDETSKIADQSPGDAGTTALFPRPAVEPQGFAFGAFVLDLRRGALLREGVEIRLRPKSLDVLACVVRHAPRLLTKQELMDAVWPDVAVTDDSLVQCLVEIRRALGDDHAWVHTSRGRGYRFDGDVRRLTAGDGATSVVTSPASAPAVSLVADEPAPASGVNRRALVDRRRWRVIALVAAALATACAAGWAMWPRRPATVNRAEATRAWREGEASIERRTRDSLARAVDAYERAIALDPTYAPAWAGLANALTVRGVYGALRPADAYPRAHAAALQAVALDPMLADAHVSVGHIRVMWDRDWRGAEESYRRARALDPNNPRSHMLYAHFLVSMGRFDEGLRESGIALAMGPRSPMLSTSAAILLLLSDHPEEAIEQGRRAIQLDPGFSLTHFWMALALAQVHRFDEAMVEALASREEAGNLPAAIVGYIHGRAGRVSEAREVLHALEEARTRSIYVPPTDLALIAVGMGDRETALMWLERAFEERAHWITLLRVWRPFDPLRDEPRFQALVAKMQFP